MAHDPRIAPRTPFSGAQFDDADPARTSSTATGPRTFANGYLFGIPLRDLGWFSTLLMGLATGMAGFFAATFFAIMGILVWNTAGHHTVDFAWSYTRFGFPVGLFVMLAALAYLGTQWVRRQMRRNR